MKDFYRPHILLIPGGFSSSSSSPTTSTDNTATEQGKAATNSEAAVQTGDSSLAVGAGGKYQESGANDLSGLTNSGTISFNDPAELTALANQFAATTQNIAGNAASSNLASNNAFLQGLQQLAQSQQTGGLTPLMETFLWLALGGLALIAFIFRKKI